MGHEISFTNHKKIVTSAYSVLIWLMLNLTNVKRLEIKKYCITICWKCFITPNNTIISKDKKYKIKNRLGNKCSQCGSTHDITIDHITPRALGGSNSYNNLQLLCGDCNKIKTEQDGIRYTEMILGIRRDTCYKTKIWKHLAKSK